MLWYRVCCCTWLYQCKHECRSLYPFWDISVLNSRVWGWCYPSQLYHGIVQWQWVDNEIISSLPVLVLILLLLPSDFSGQIALLVYLLLNQNIIFLSLTLKPHIILFSFHRTPVSPFPQLSHWQKFADCLHWGSFLDLMGLQALIPCLKLWCQQTDSSLPWASVSQLQKSFSPVYILSTLLLSYTSSFPPSKACPTLKKALEKHARQDLTQAGLNVWRFLVQQGSYHPNSVP